jgi:hypothetical protein
MPRSSSQHELGDRAARDERTFDVVLFARALAFVLTLVVVGCGAEPERVVEPEPPRPATLVLAGDGEMWVVDVAAERARHVQVPELSPGDPDHRVVWRSDRFVFWGYATYAVADLGEPLGRIADDTWFFIPSVHRDRVWVTVLDPSSPATVNALKAVREITVDGHVTVPDVEPPGGRWPQGAVTSGLLFYRDRGWSVWDPRTGENVSRLNLGGPLGPTHGDMIASCAAEPCIELWLTDARTGRRRIARAPEGKAFQLWEAAFSPDGRQLAAPVNDASASPSESPADLALIDVGSLETQIVPGSTVSPYYVFTAWSAEGDQVFITGGERFKPRTIVAYRLGHASARALDVKVGDFYDMAAR